MAFYMWDTTKIKKGYKYNVRRKTERKTKNKKGSYLDSKVVHTGVKPTRARAKAQAQRYIRLKKRRR